MGFDVVKVNLFTVYASNDVFPVLCVQEVPCNGFRIRNSSLVGCMLYHLPSVVFYHKEAGWSETNEKLVDEGNGVITSPCPFLVNDPPCFFRTLDNTKSLTHNDRSWIVFKTEVLFPLLQETNTMCFTSKAQSFCLSFYSVCKVAYVATS